MYQDLYDAIENQPISDTHEHIIASETLARHRRGLIELIGEAYLHDDLISAGADESCFDADASDAERWERLRPHLACVRNTTYYRCLIDALNDLYHGEITQIDDSNWEWLNGELLRTAAMGAEWYEQVLHKQAKIVHCMLDMDRTSNTEVGLWAGKGLKSIQDNCFEERFFRRVARTDLLLNIVHPLARGEVAGIYGLNLCSMDDLDELVERFARRAREQHAVAYKSVAAYFRTLSIEQVGRERAQRSWLAVCAGTACTEDELTVQNYLLHRLILRAGENGIPFQFHTGMQALNANTIDNSNPLRLNPILLQYPQVKFTLLHGGYPFYGAAGVIAKKFPNVFLDFSWLPQIGFAAAKHALAEWLDLVPMNKLTWGGDCRHVENSYSAVLLLRKLLYEVLSDKLDHGRMDMDTAKEIVRRCMFENAETIYRL